MAAPTHPSEQRRPILDVWRKTSAKRTARLARERARQRVRPTAKSFQDGTVVEIGKSEVDVAEHDGSRTHTDHRDALGRVESGYFSPERGERLAVVRTEDNKLRAVPERRLRAVGGGGPKGFTSPTAGRSTAVSMSGTGDAWDRVFGKRTATDELVRLGKIKA